MADEFKISALTSASLTAVKLHGLIPVAIAENDTLPIDTYKVDISELIALIENNTIDYWIYGHHHVNVEEFSIGQTKMLTNQLGYLRYDENKYFTNGKIIHI